MYVLFLIRILLLGLVSDPFRYSIEPDSVAYPDPGSGAFFTPGPGSGIRIRFFSGARIPTPYFLELSAKFLGKKFYNSLKTGPNFFLQQLKNNLIYNFVKFVATKKRFDN
jgi:hypothetical protein